MSDRADLESRNHLFFLLCSLLPKDSLCLLVPEALSFMPPWRKLIVRKAKLKFTVCTELFCVSTVAAEAV